NLTNEIDDFQVVRVDPATKEVLTKSGTSLKADVANIIPPQKAGEIAFKAGCTEGDWCPVKPDTFASAKAKDVYVLGDSAISAEVRKANYVESLAWYHAIIADAFNDTTAVSPKG